MGYGDYLEFGLFAKEEEETLKRLVDRYGVQGYKLNIFLTDPSMRAVGEGHKVLGQTANDILHAKTRYWPGRALYHREGFGRIWQGSGSQDWSLPCRLPCSTLQQKKVQVRCGFAHRSGFIGNLKLSVAYVRPMRFSKR